MSELEYPDDLRYTADHEWVRPAADTGASGEVVVRVGITAYAQDALGDVVYVSLPEVGAQLTEGQSCGEVESTKSVSDIFSPLSGEVRAVNVALEANPELINSDPYGDGWMFELLVADRADLEGLLDSKAYEVELD
ncbi:MAG: glycine cleavage system protein GcvH [Austwickia sp.]|jgi:glycine cleavage system H protein|nr:glycine cleavage system protein GcvH [Austwickia sp.]MBK8435240.1 glycine cleavage system protein GcvH [Austwickia sp.]MBK9101208.1 glycine cleavage system protein GcvH [Austwickia sp.]